MGSEQSHLLLTLQLVSRWLTSTKKSSEVVEFEVGHYCARELRLVLMLMLMLILILILIYR